MSWSVSTPEMAADTFADAVNLLSLPTQAKADGVNEAEFAEKKTVLLMLFNSEKLMADPNTTFQGTIGGHRWDYAGFDDEKTHIGPFLGHQTNVNLTRKDYK